MNDKNRNLLVRVVSALTLFPIVMVLVYLGGLWTAALYAVAAAACAWEYYTITGVTGRGPGLVGILGAAAMPLFPIVIPQHAGDLAFWWIAGFHIFFFSWFLFTGAIKESPGKIAHLTTGFIYASVGTVALSFVRIREDGGWWTVVAMLLTWSNDTFAYFFGRFLGKHKMNPEVSPNKTWEGFAGGMLGSVGMMFFLRGVFFDRMTVQDCIILGILGGIFGPLGDFCESMLKRSYGVKDSGKSIPGHGGMLDRVDALLFNAFLVFCYLQFARGFV